MDLLMIHCLKNLSFIIYIKKLFTSNTSTWYKALKQNFWPLLQSYLYLMDERYIQDMIGEAFDFWAYIDDWQVSSHVFPRAWNQVHQNAYCTTLRLNHGSSHQVQETWLVPSSTVYYSYMRSFMLHFTQFKYCCHDESLYPLQLLSDLVKDGEVLGLWSIFRIA